MNNPKEKMKLNIELADNGIIIRNPVCEDDVFVVVTSEAKTIHNKQDFTNEYKEIGRKVYDWLLDVVNEHENDFIITNFDLDIIATCKGRNFR